MFLEQKIGQYHMNNMSAKLPLRERAIAHASGKQTRKRNSRWRLLLALLAGVLLIVIVLIAASLQRASTTLTVQVAGQSTSQIDLNESLALSPYLLGSNVFPQEGTNAKDQTGQGFMSYKPQVVEGLRSAGIKLLRFPGGNWGEQHTPSVEQLNDFSNLLKQVGAEGFMQAQLSDPLDDTPVPLATRATRAALLVNYMNNSQSIQRTGTNARDTYHPIKYWSVGNEPDLLINQDTGQRYTVEEYTQAFIVYSLAMHQKDTSIKVFGPEISQYSGAGSSKAWMESFLKGISAYENTHSLPFRLLDGVSFHFYPFADTEENANAMLSNPELWGTLAPALHQLIRQTVGQDLPLAITEINTNPGQGGPPSNLSALWWAETLGELMSNQVEYVTFFSTEGVDSPLPLFLQKDLTQTAMLRTMQLFSHLQNNLVPTQGQGTRDLVSIYATQDSEHNTVSLLLLNKTKQSQRISIHASSSLPFNPWLGVNLTLPGYQMVVLTLHRSGGNEAFLFSNQVSEQEAVPDVQHLVCGSQTDSAFAC